MINPIFIDPKPHDWLGPGSWGGGEDRVPESILWLILASIAAEKGVIQRMLWQINAKKDTTPSLIPPSLNVPPS